ncbi:MAG TPA: nuclear transport factor 2 family protein [Streptosporangiaceae bacterium]
MGPRSPGEVVDAAYELLSFEPGGEPDWAGFRQCFHERAILALRVFPGDPAISVLSLAEYARAQLREGLREEGYTELPQARDIDITGSVATIRQHFTMNFARRDPVPAIDIFALIRLDDRWQIVSVVSDLAGDG